MHLDVVRIDLVDGFVRTTYIDYNGVQYVTEVPVTGTVMKASKMKKEATCEHGTVGCSGWGDKHACPSPPMSRMRRDMNNKVEILDDDGNVVGKQG